MRKIEEQYDKLYRYCYSKVKDVYLAEDITQEAFLKYFESAGYREMGKPMAYLYTVARNLCMDEFRRKKHERLPDDLYSDSYEEKILDRLDIEMALDELTPDEREILLLRFADELSVSDIGSICKISRFAVYRGIKKSLKKLERRLSDV